MKKNLWQIAIAAFAMYTPMAYSSVETEELCVEPDHYLSYEFNSLLGLPTGTVSLRDQFIGGTGDPAAFEAFTLGAAVRLLNPATKYHLGKIHRPESPNNHYVAISISSTTLDDIPEQEVLVFNQFGNHTFTIFSGAEVDADDTDLTLAGGDPVLQLLVPSVKGACPGGECAFACDDCFPDGDHYLCYELSTEDDICPANARFDDQFIKNRVVEDLIPRRLCTPVDKTFNGVTSFADQSETNHLLCYEISNGRNIPTHLVNLLNQLGQQRGWVRVNDEVCVPSTKVVTVPPVTPGAGLLSSL